MRILALITVTVLAACGSRALAPGPTAPAALSATGTTDGVTLRLDLDRASLTPGEVVWATIAIENTNDHAIQWVDDGCGVPGQVTAAVSVLAEPGKGWDYPFAELKKRLALVFDPGHLRFVDAQRWSSAGTRSCPASVRAVELAPHGKLTSRHAWNGMIEGAPAPDGDVRVTGGLEMNDLAHMVGTAVSATVTLRLTGGAPTRVSPGQAIDAAFADDRFASWVRVREVQRGTSPAAAYDVTGGVRLDGDAWVITASQKAPPAGEIEVRVGAIDGVVRSVVQR